MSRKSNAKRAARKRASGRHQARAQGSDATLRTLLANCLALPPGSVRMGDGLNIVATADFALYALAVRDRCLQLGGNSDVHIHAALRAIGHAEEGA